MNDVKLRLADITDAESLLAIYAEYIATSITFESVLLTVEEFRQRITEISAVYPYIVCEHKGEIVGYAYVHRFKERAAYAWGVESSIYLKPQSCGMGLGKILYRALLDICRAQNIRTIYGCVTSPNIPSEHLHQSLGFRHIGTLYRAGYKAGNWHDVNWYEKSLGDYPPNPPEIKKISEISADILAEILANVHQVK